MIKQVKNKKALHPYPGGELFCLAEAMEVPLG